MSSIFGRSVRSFRPKRIRNSLRRGVQERPADHVLTADDLDQVPLEQRRKHTGRIDAANLADLGAVIGCL